MAFVTMKGTIGHVELAKENGGKYTSHTRGESKHFCRSTLRERLRYKPDTFSHIHNTLRMPPHPFPWLRTVYTD